jgi:peptidoglycan/xylan/chitin deacetylase (PgdA/CDA1 family)
MRIGTKSRIENFLAASFPATSRTGRIVVLCYHSVHPSNGIRSATPALFERHLGWLAEHCEVVPFRSIPDAMTVAARGKPVVAITFDDGYEDNHRVALPILTRLGLPATIFVTTGLIDQEPAVIRRFAKVWHASEDDVRGMTWDQVEDARAAGVEIGAHTRTHPILRDLDDQRAEEEIGGSKRTIEDHLGVRVTSFAYPFGKPREHLTGRTVDLVAQLGFRSAAAIRYRGVRPGDDPLCVPRFAVTEDPVDVLAAKVAGRLEVIGLWQAYDPRTFTRPIARRLADPDRSSPSGVA